MTQDLRPNSEEINSVSVIIGLDSSTADLGNQHPVKLVVRSEDGRINTTLPRTDVVNNAYTRFDFSEPLRVRPNEILTIQIFNESPEPVGVYVKQPGAADVAEGVVSGPVVIGHLGRESEYRLAGHALSGCVTRPG